MSSDTSEPADASEKILDFGEIQRNRRAALEVVGRVQEHQTTLADQLDARDERIKELESTNAELEGKYVRETQTLKQQLVDAGNDNAALSKKGGELMTQNEDLKRQLAERDSQIAALKGEVSQSDSAFKEILMKLKTVLGVVGAVAVLAVVALAGLKGYELYHGGPLLALHGQPMKVAQAPTPVSSPPVKVAHAPTPQSAGAPTANPLERPVAA